jgi:dTDP-4-amino-4,6-dideoxygalactose transaminase
LLDRAIADVIDSGAFAGGPFVEQFEQEFARACECRYAVGVGSGTEALWLALLAFGIGAGDEVITVPMTFMATAEAITYAGATPVFADVDERTYTMNPAQLANALTPKTKAIIPVHLFGQPADMEPIVSFARAHNLIVIEDAAQAHGAQYKGKAAGSLGHAGCFSFYPGKNLGALGEAGALVTNDFDLQSKVRILRDHGQSQKYLHKMVGWNCRMDGIQGAVLRVKLGCLENWNRVRRDRAKQYAHSLAKLEEVKLPFEADYAHHVYHIYAVRVQERDEVMRFLKDNGIDCGIHYPRPIHLQEAYCDLGYGAGDFPVAEKIAREFISLPMSAELTEEQVGYVVERLRDAVSTVLVS